LEYSIIALSIKFPFPYIPSMLQHIKGILKPEGYHGKNESGPFFEGWYYKCVDPKNGHSLAIIPGIYKSPDEEYTEAFIQILDGSKNKSCYIRFDAGDFLSYGTSLDISIGPNRFTEGFIYLDLQDGDWQMNGSLTFSGNRPWPSSVRSPGCMGWYAWMPFMQCYHGVVSMDHVVNGELVVNGKTLHFEKGRGYIEKDWGKAFPRNWIWLQANHFSAQPLSLFVSVAHVPWIRGAFNGFIAGLLTPDDGLIQFTTYNKARIQRLIANPPVIEMELINGSYRLQLRAETGKSAILKAPTEKGMLREIDECLNAHIAIYLWKNDRLVLKDESSHGGAEIVGDYKGLEVM